MVNLSSLVHELRERIAASSSTPPNKENDDALGARFRTVLPNLLHTYVVPLPSVKEREVMVVLKLLTHTAKNFLRVFYQGKATAILPIIGRILPFFVEPAFGLSYSEKSFVKVGIYQMVKGADYALDSLHNIREAIPEL